MDVILLDLDDTLIADVRARDQALKATLAELCDSPVGTADALRTIRDTWRSTGLRDVPGLAGVSSWEALWTDFDAAHDDPSVQTAGRQFQVAVWGVLGTNSAVDGRSATETFRHYREAMVKPFDWVAPTLSAWRNGHELWCVTNGSAWLQRRKLTLAGLDGLVEEVFTSGDLGAIKTEKAFHDHIARALLDRRQRATVVVGDRANSDGALARALGIDFAFVVPGDPPAWTPIACGEPTAGQGSVVAE